MTIWEECCCKIAKTLTVNVWWFTIEKMDFATQLDMVSMYADAYSKLITYRFKFNLLLSVNDPH